MTKIMEYILTDNEDFSIENIEVDKGSVIALTGDHDTIDEMIYSICGKHTNDNYYGVFKFPDLNISNNENTFSKSINFVDCRQFKNIFYSKSVIKNIDLYLKFNGVLDKKYRFDIATMIFDDFCLYDIDCEKVEEISREYKIHLSIVLAVINKADFIYFEYDKFTTISFISLISSIKKYSPNTIVFVKIIDKERYNDEFLNLIEFSNDNIDTLEYKEKFIDIDLEDLEDYKNEDSKKHSSIGILIYIIKNAILSNITLITIAFFIINFFLLAYISDMVDNIYSNLDQFDKSFFETTILKIPTLLFFVFVSLYSRIVFFVYMRFKHDKCLYYMLFLNVTNSKRRVFILNFIEKFTLLFLPLYFTSFFVWFLIYSMIGYRSFIIIFLIGLCILLLFILIFDALTSNSYKQHIEKKVQILFK